jgi:hypothetical protein
VFPLPIITIAVGNRRFKICVENHLHAYIEASWKKSKSLVVTRILDTIRASSQAEGGGFIRKDRLNKRWYEVKEKIAREKVGQALRDASLEFLKNKEEDGEHIADSRSIPGLAPESPRKDSPAARDTPSGSNLLEPEDKKRKVEALSQFIPEPLALSDTTPVWSMQSQGKIFNESFEMDPIVSPRSVRQVVCEQEALSDGPSSDLIYNKQNRSRIMTKRGTSSMMDNFFKAATNLNEDWMPAWAPLDFEPTPLRNVCVSRQA